MFEEKKAFSVPNDKETEPVKEIEFFDSEENRVMHFAEGKKRVREGMKIARGKFNKKNKEGNDEITSDLKWNTEKVFKGKKKKYTIDDIVRAQKEAEVLKDEIEKVEEKWEEIVKYIEEEARKETDIDDIIASINDIFSGLEEDCFYTLYQAILLKLQLIYEKKVYIVKKDNNK